MENVVSFKVSGSELSSFISDVQKKQDNLATTAISGAVAQTKQSREQLKVIEEIIKAEERRNNARISADRKAILDSKNTEVSKIEAKRKQNIDFLDSKVGVPGYTDDYITTNKAKSNKQADEALARVNAQSREQLTSVKETEKQSKLQTSIAKENLEAIKLTAKENIKAITSGDMKLSDVISRAQTEEEKLVARLTEQGIREEKKLQEKEGGGGKSIMSGLLAVENLNKILATSGQLASSQNGFDMIKPTASAAGQIIGGILGGIIGSFVGPEGTFIGAQLGSSVGNSLGSSTGELFQRSAVAKEDLYRSKGRWQAVTGNDELPDTTNTERYGINITDFLKMQTDAAIKRGNAATAGKTATDALTADRGYGVEQSTSAMLIELQRSAKEGNKDLAALIGGVLQKGEGSIFKNGDHTFLNEFLNKFSSLQKELLKYQTNVATGTTFDILSKFNKVGGEFSASDPRSMGNINAIQNGLSNPGTDNLKALSFGVLRRENPNASILDLLAERQKGLGSPAYLKGMLKAVDQIGGDESQKGLNLMGMFPGLSISAIKRLLQNRQGLESGNISMDELKSKYKDDFSSRAEANTPEINKAKARIDNGLLQDKYETVEALADAFKTAIESSMSGAVIQLNDNRGTISFPSKGAIIKNNATKSAAKAKSDQDYYNKMSDYDPNNQYQL